MLLGILLLVFTAVSCALFVARPVWFPVAITSAAAAYDQQFSLTLWIVAALFVAAQVLLAAALLRRPRTPVLESATKSSSRMEIFFAVAAVLLFTGLALAGSRGWAIVPSTTAEALASKEVIEVYAHQFAWNFRYPGPDHKFGRASREFVSDAGANPIGIDPSDPAGIDDRTTASLRIPAGRDVLLLLHSRDVIHDFFVRELRTKQDIVPGMEIPFELHVDRPGIYEIACAELCGLGHSQMHSQLIVMTTEDYARWQKTK